MFGSAGGRTLREYQTESSLAGRNLAALRAKLEVPAFLLGKPLGLTEIFGEKLLNCLTVR